MISTNCCERVLNWLLSLAQLNGQTVNTIMSHHNNQLIYGKIYIAIAIIAADQQVILEQNLSQKHYFHQERLPCFYIYPYDNLESLYENHET